MSMSIKRRPNARDYIGENYVVAGFSPRSQSIVGRRGVALGGSGIAYATTCVAVRVWILPSTATTTYCLPLYIYVMGTPVGGPGCVGVSQMRPPVFLSY